VLPSTGISEQPLSSIPLLPPAGQEGQEFARGFTQPLPYLKTRATCPVGRNRLYRVYFTRDQLEVNVVWNGDSKLVRKPKE
jgi:hypothetical protein